MPASAKTALLQTTLSHTDLNPRQQAAALWAFARARQGEGMVDRFLRGAFCAAAEDPNTPEQTRARFKALWAPTCRNEARQQCDGLPAIMGKLGLTLSEDGFKGLGIAGLTFKTYMATLARLSEKAFHDSHATGRNLLKNEDSGRGLVRFKEAHKEYTRAAYYGLFHEILKDPINTAGINPRLINGLVARLERKHEPESLDSLAPTFSAGYKKSALAAAIMILRQGNTPANCTLAFEYMRRAVTNLNPAAAASRTAAQTIIQKNLFTLGPA